MGKGGGSNKKQIEKQYEYDTNKWEYQWAQMNIDSAYKQQAFDIKVHNAEQVRNVKNQQAKNEWLDKEKMRMFNYGNQVEAYNSGKDKLFGYFVGQVMKETQGKANPKSVNEILKRLLSC